MAGDVTSIIYVGVTAWNSTPYNLIRHSPDICRDTEPDVTKRKRRNPWSGH